MSDVSTKIASSACRSGDRLCLDELDVWLRSLTAFLVSAIHAYAPQVVVIGGGAAHAADLFLKPLRARVRSWPDTVAWCAFGLHVAAGILILVHFAQTGRYIEYDYTWRVL